MKEYKGKIFMIPVFIVAIMMLFGCQNSTFAPGTYAYWEISKPEFGLGINTESGSLAFFEVWKYYLQPDDEEKASPDEGLFWAMEGGDVVFGGEKGVLNGIATINGDIIAMPSRLSMPGYQGLGFAVKKEEKTRSIDGSYEIVAQRFIGTLFENDVQNVRGTVIFNEAEGTFVSSMSNDEGEEFTDSGSFVLLDDGTVSWTDDSVGADFVGHLNSTNTAIFVNADTSSLNEFSHYVLFAAKSEEGTHDLEGEYRLQLFDSTNGGGEAQLNIGTIEFGPANSCAINIDDEVNNFVVNSTDGTASFTLEDGEGGTVLIGAMCPTSDNSVLVLSTFNSEASVYIVATRIADPV